MCSSNSKRIEVYARRLCMNLVDLPDYFIPITCKWIYKTKGIPELTLNDSKLDWLQKGSLGVKKLILMKLFFNLQE